MTNEIIPNTPKYRAKKLINKILHFTKEEKAKQCLIELIDLIILKQDKSYEFYKEVKKEIEKL